MDTTCVFCNIAAGKEKSFCVYEDANFFAFLDRRPLFPGHCLLIPKTHYETFYDLPINILGPFFALTQRLGGAIQDALPAQGSFIAMNNKISQSVAHLHVHIVPRNKQDGLKGFFWPRQLYRDDAHMHEIMVQIKKMLDK